MRNTLFGSLLLLAASASAQQATSTAPVRVSVGRQADMAAPPPARVAQVNGVATTNQEGSFFFSGDKQIREEDLKSKEVSKEIPVSKASEIYIENSSRSIVVKTWDQPKVKVSATVYFEGESKLSDEEWLERVNLSLKTLGSSVKIKAGSVGGSAYTINGQGFTYSSGVATVFSSNGQNMGTNTKLKRTVTITVPAGSKLDIESKYADVQLPAGISDASVDITNGNLEADNLNKLMLRSKYSNANVGNIKTAELEFANGRFSAKEVDELDVDSKYSTIEMASAKKISLRSTNDEYEIEEAGEVTGRKNYGNLRITKLNGSMEIDGANADIKVRKVGPALTSIKVDNRYADIRIPLREVKNYSVQFAGPYSSVYGNFEKQPVAETKTESTGSGSSASPTRIMITGTLASAGTGRWGDSGPSKFTATVGDGKGLKIDMKCQNCTVDFK
ncbi:DUF4097 domain-containing protein [Sediminibacterium soli]|uniref:DUF4097 domain-containing protein n=1 Tax=Sediminibacterium soli TaxID=2698829 RepID=UPI0013797AAF|nr:DUF4097 domain-containing protein [Sediminibacterium soli]